MSYTIDGKKFMNSMQLGASISFWPSLILFAQSPFPLRPTIKMSPVMKQFELELFELGLV